MKYTLKHLREFYPVNDFFDSVIKNTVKEFNNSKELNQSDIYAIGSGKVNYSNLEWMITNNSLLSFIYDNIFSNFNVNDIYRWSSVQYAYINLKGLDSANKIYSDILYQLLPTYVVELNIYNSSYNNMRKAPNNERYYDSNYRSGYYNMTSSKSNGCYNFNEDNYEESKLITPLQLVKLMDKIIFNLYKEFDNKFKKHVNCNSLSINTLLFKDSSYEMSKYAGQPFYTFTICNNYIVNCEYFNDVVYELKTEKCNSNFVLNIIVFPFLKEMLIINDDYRRLKTENKSSPIINYYSTKYNTNVTQEEFDKVIMNLIQNFLDYFKERTDEVIALCKERLDHKDESKNVYEINITDMIFSLNSKQCILIGNILINNLISFIDSDNEKQFLYYNNFYNTKLSGDPRMISTLSDIPVIKDKFTKTASGENITIKKARQNYNLAVSSARNLKRWKFVSEFQKYCKTFYREHYDHYEKEFNEKILFDEDFSLMLPSIGFIVNNATDNNIGLTISFRRDFTQSRPNRDSCSYTLNRSLKDMYWYEKLFDIFISNDILTMKNSILYNPKFYNLTNHQLDFEYAANNLYDDTRLYTYRNDSYAKINCIYQLNLNKSNKITLIQLMLQYLDRIFKSKEFLEDMIKLYNNYLEVIKNDNEVKKAIENVNVNKTTLDQIIDLGNNQLNKQLNNILLKDYDDLSIYMLEASFYLSETINIAKVIM